MPLLHSNQRLLLPVNPLFVVSTLGIAVLLNCFPFSGLPFVPDVIALCLLFWAIHQPRLVSMGFGFLLGLLMDVIYATTFGQYALAYVLLAYLGNSFSTRILRFHLTGQMFHVFPMLLIAQITVAVIGKIIHNIWPEWSYFTASATAVLLWPLCNFALLAPQRRPVEKDANRPI
jgi:rod shape-determining protein MreD